MKGAEAYKFRCLNGHIFYKFLTELQSYSLRLNRKLSKTTASSGNSSDVESRVPSSAAKTGVNVAGAWCPKCESFYRNCQEVAQQSGFSLVGEMFAEKLSLRCNKAKHEIPLSYQRRLQVDLKCAGCKRDEREAAKKRLRDEERRQNEYYAKMQERMFQEAREEMHKKLAQGPTFGGPAFGASFSAQAAAFDS